MSHLFQTFWFGGALSPYETLCLASFVAHGHRVDLHTYDAGLQVPEGVTLRDAAAIAPPDAVFRYRGGVGAGSVAAFANLFRYELLLREGGWWIDTDMVCLGGAIPESATFFALEQPGQVNCAMIRFPPDHPVMRACRDESRRLGADLAWGQTGPRLLTAVLAGQGLLGEAAPSATCYPFDWTQTVRLFDPAAVAALHQANAGAFAIHLWNEILRRAGIHKWVGVPPGCYLDELFRRHGIGFPDQPRYAAGDIERLDRNRLAQEAAEVLGPQVGRLEAALREAVDGAGAARAESAATIAALTGISEAQERRSLDLVAQRAGLEQSLGAAAAHVEALQADAAMLRARLARIEASLAWRLARHLGITRTPGP